MKEKKTSWGGVAKWYDSLLEKEEKNYQKDLILPNLLRLMSIKKGEAVLDLACGQGFFSREFAKFGAKVAGVDISKELIDIARKTIGDSRQVDFFASPAHKLDFIDSTSVDKIAIVLAVQNIENISEVFAECARVLKPAGRVFMVMNHPAFRIPKASSWGWDDAEKKQFRRVDSYMSESTVKIQMHPGGKPDEITVSFHRPLQIYFKALKKNGFTVAAFEEWVSNKTSESGPRAKEENRMRKEIPLFMVLEAVRISKIY